MDIFLATANAHKAAEIRALLRHTGISVITLIERPDLLEPEETGVTFEDNALIKARALHGLTGMAVIADDSGLEVASLGGLPGVHSKRFSAEATAEANNARLLRALEPFGDPTLRAARFRCVVALVTRGFSGVVEGICEGRIGTEARGNGGFGYDPLFEPDEAPGRTMAQLSMEEKNAISHRGKALRGLPELLARAASER